MTLKPGQKVRLVKIGRFDAYYPGIEMLGSIWMVREARRNLRVGLEGWWGIFSCDKFPNVTCFAEAYFEPLEGRNKIC